MPLLSGSRVAGKLSAATRVAAVYGDAHVERLRRVGRMIGPFIEVIALLYRERRRRHRMNLLAGITELRQGTTLDLRETSAPSGRPSGLRSLSSRHGRDHPRHVGLAVGVLRNRRRASSARH